MFLYLHFEFFGGLQLILDSVDAKFIIQLFQDSTGLLLVLFCICTVDMRLNYFTLVWK